MDEPLNWKKKIGWKRTASTEEIPNWIRSFGQKFKVLKVDKTLVDYYTKLSDFHAQFRAIGTNYNQVVKELRIHFSEKKAMALLYKLEKHTIDLVKLSREIVELSREMYAKWEQRKG